MSKKGREFAIIPQVPFLVQLYWNAYVFKMLVYQIIYNVQCKEEYCAFEKHIYMCIYILFTFIYLLVDLKLHIEGLYVIDIGQLIMKFYL